MQHQQVEHLEEFVQSGEFKKSIYGYVWGHPLIHRQLVHQWIIPAVRKYKRIVEVGVGGGRWILTYLSAIDHAYLVDGTTCAETAVRHWHSGPFDFIVSTDGLMNQIPSETEPYIFSYDAFVHFDKELFDSYLSEVSRILTPTGVFHFNFAYKPNSKTDDSSNNFVYRDLDELKSVLASNGLMTTDRQINMGGYGSLVIEVQKCPR